MINQPLAQNFHRYVHELSLALVIYDYKHYPLFCTLLSINVLDFNYLNWCVLTS